MANGTDGFSVKIAKLGSAVKEVFLPTGSTVGDAVRLSEFPTAGLDVKRNGRVVANGESVSANDFLTIAPKKIAGGSL